MASGTDERHYPDDDIEANALDARGNGKEQSLDDKNLSEFEALDKFITSYDASGQQVGGEGDPKADKVPWWKFWKSSEGDDTDQSADKEGKPPAAWLETDIRQGVQSSQVEERRRHFGWNELTAEKENQLAKFLSFFQGPILYGRYPIATCEAWDGCSIWFDETR